MITKNRKTCPCCGYLTVNRKKDFPICRICQWQHCADTLVSSEDTTCNGITLEEGQQNYIKYGVSKNLEMYIKQQHPIKETDIKDKDWRIINDGDIFLEVFTEEKQKKICDSIDWDDYHSYCYWKEDNIIKKAHS